LISVSLRHFTSIKLIRTVVALRPGICYTWPMSTRKTLQDAAGAACEIDAWLARYRPVEREIMEARARREASRMRRREAQMRRDEARRAEARSFGDLCELSEGRAVRWRQDGIPESLMWHYAGHADGFLDSAAPLLLALGLSDRDIMRLVPRSGPVPLLAERAADIALLAMAGPACAALVCFCLLPAFVCAATRRIAALQARARRPLYYGRDRERRERLAAERRRIRRRTTLNACPTREAVLDAWVHARDSKESLLRFGSLMQDLECYLDSSLVFDEAGRIVGRKPGVKGWLRENIPALALRYTTVIRYKAAAKKLRQIVGLDDPVPVDVVLGGPGGAPDGGEGGSCAPCNYGAYQKDSVGGDDRCGGDVAKHGGGKCGGDKAAHDGMRLEGTSLEGKRMKGMSLEVVRARALYIEALGETGDVAAHVLARIDALCSPERLEEANMLESWRRRYAAAITVRTKDAWWRRMTGRRKRLA